MLSFEIYSMDLLEVIVKLDEKCGVEIPEADHGKMTRSILEKSGNWFLEKMKDLIVESLF